MMDSNPHTRNAPKMNSFVPACSPVTDETPTPKVSGMIQISVDTKSRPKSRLADTIDLRSMIRIRPVSRNAAMGAVMMHAPIISSESGLVIDASSMSAPLETMRSRRETAKEGRTKRCLYRFASCAVDDPYSWTYLKSRFMIMEPMISAIEAARTNCGLIFTPSVSSSKKRSRPALDAGIGAFFFLLLIVGSLRYAHVGARQAF